MSIAKHIDVSGLIRIACREEDEKSIYTLKINKNMNPDNRRMSEGYLWMDDMRDMKEESNA